MVPFNSLEQLDTDFLELVSPDAGQRLRPDRIEIGINQPIRERSHGQARCLDVAEHNTLVAHDCDRRVQLMAAAGERSQLLAGGGAGGWLVKALLPERKRLIGSDHNSSWPL